MSFPRVYRCHLLWFGPSAVPSSSACHSARSWRLSRRQVFFVIRGVSRITVRFAWLPQYRSRAQAHA